MQTLQTFPVLTPAQLSVHLKALRKASGLTQAALGQRIGVKQVRVAEIERDPGAVNMAQLLQILHALDARMLIGKAAAATGTGRAVQEPPPAW